MVTIMWQFTFRKIIKYCLGNYVPRKGVDFTDLRFTEEVNTNIVFDLFGNTAVIMNNN